MKTEQGRIEQMDKMAQVMCGFCTEDKRCVLRYSAPCSDVASQDCSYKENAEMLISAGYGDVSEYKAEIERLKAKNEKLLDSIESVQAGRCRLRCPLTEQAVKEFAERLKKYSYTDNCFKDGKWHRYVLVSDIDELIKEVENSEKSSH